MTIDKRYTLDHLTNLGVSVLEEHVLVLDDGTEKPLAQTSRRGYVNSVEERLQLKENVPEPYRSAVLAVWGDTPTVTEECAPREEQANTTSFFVRPHPCYNGIVEKDGEDAGILY